MNYAFIGFMYIYAQREDKHWGEEGGLEEMHLKFPLALLFKEINYWNFLFFFSSAMNTVDFFHVL